MTSPNQNEMTIEQLLQECRQDYFVEPSCKILQHKNHFCVNSDSADLARFITIRPDEEICEIGTNNGALLVYLDRFKPKSLTGIEILDMPALLARENLKTIQHATSHVFCGSVVDFPDYQFDVVLSNPPYFELSDREKKQIEQGTFSHRQLARFEHNLDLETLIQQVSRLLRSYGRFYLVHRPDRLVETILMMNRYKLAASKIQIIYDARDQQPKAFLLEAVKEGTCKARILEPLYRGA